MAKKQAMLENSRLDQLAKDKKFTEAFPALKRLNNLPKRGCCGQGQRKRAETYRQVKRDLAGLASDKKRKLREMLKVDEVRIRYKQNDGQVKQLTF